MDQLDQANTIYSYVLLVFQAFQGFSGPEGAKWRHRLETMASVSQLVAWDSDGAPSFERIGEDITLRRLPRLLCIAVASTVEAALEDVAIVVLSDLLRESSPDEIERKAKNIMRSGVATYLRDLATQLQQPYFLNNGWLDFQELVATRNLLVHKPKLIADAHYLKQAGPRARAQVSEALSMDDAYMMSARAITLELLDGMLRLEWPPRSN